MAKSQKIQDDKKINSTVFADQKGLNKYQRFALIKQYPIEEFTVSEWEEICKQINL